MRVLPALCVALISFSCLAAWTSTQAAGTLDQKLEHIRVNATLAHPDPAPTDLSEQEINAYMASPEIQLPPGVRSVRLQGQPGVITGTSRVDFDSLKAGMHSSNPLLSIFSGVHEVEVVAHAHGRGGRGFVEVQRVSLDGVEIPRFVLELFVEKYLQPRYPNIGLDSRFALPDRIDTAVVGVHKLTVMQR
jgi:hypothetical protein